MEPPMSTPSWYAKARTSRDTFSDSCSGLPAGGFWEGRLQRPLRPSRPGMGKRSKQEPRPREIYKLPHVVSLVTTRAPMKMPAPRQECKEKNNEHSNVSSRRIFQNAY